MDMSAKSQNAFWDANDSVIKLWEFDATFDYRVCLRCYPFDGKRAEDRSSLPDTPVHPNCRCRILPLTESALELEKEQMAKGELTMNTVEIGSPPPNARVYKKKVKVDGEKTTRFGVTYKVPRGERPTAALFLRRANAETRAAVLGKDNARRFGEMLRDGRDEVDALQEIIKHPTRRRKGKAVREIAKGLNPAKARAVKAAAQKKATIAKVNKAKAKAKGGGPKVDVSQMRRAKAGGEYGPDGHWYPGGAFIPDGDYVGKKALGKGVAPDIKANDKNKNTVDGPVQVIKNKQNKKPRPLAPTSATGLEKPANKLSKLQQRRQDEFFDKNGFLVEDVEIKARKAGSEGRSPIDNQMFTSALANRTSPEWLKEKTAALRRAVKDKAGFDAALADATDFISYEYAELNRGMVAVGEDHYKASKSFVQALFQLAGERVSKKRGGRRPRSINEELIWILNNTLMTKRRPGSLLKGRLSPAANIAAKAEANAMSKLSRQMGDAELNAALKAVDTKVIAKVKPSVVPYVKGINPFGLFNDSSNSLGRGAFGEARLTDKGVVKKGWLNRNELAAMEKLGDSGVTPKLLGSAFEGEWKPKLFPGMSVRRGYMLMEKAPGEPLQKLIEFGGGLTEKQGKSAFESLMRARKKIHMSGVAHQDMHPGNILFDPSSSRLTVIDLGMARVDARAALVEALGTGRGVMTANRITQAGDYQSRLLFSYFNKVSGSKNSDMWKRFQQNRKAVVAKLDAEGAGSTVDASIRKLPKSVTSNLTTKRALELLNELYEGI